MGDADYELYPTMQESICLELSEKIASLELARERLSNQISDLHISIESINFNINSLVDSLEYEEKYKI